MAIRRIIESVPFAICSPKFRAALSTHRPGQVWVHLVVSPDRRYVYVSNPKVATSTIKSILVANAQGTDELRKNPHALADNPFLQLSRISRIRPIEQLERDGAKFVTLVRNPYARLYSAYQMKIVAEKPRERFAPKVIDGWVPSDGLPTFEAFARAVCAQSDRATNPHWRAQHAQTMQHVVDFDFIGHLEHLDEDLRTMLKLIEVNPSKIPHWNATSRPPGRLPYSDELAEEVAERFRRDFETFGYSTSLDDLRPTRRLSTHSNS